MAAFSGQFRESRGPAWALQKFFEFASQIHHQWAMRVSTVRNRPFQETSYLTQPSETLKLALRVLTTIIDRRYPEPNDVAALRSLAPCAGPLPIDELACEVIKGAVQLRAAARAAGARY